MTLSQSTNQKNKSIIPTDTWFICLAIIGILVNTTGLFLPILEPDGALYATISKTMALSGDYVNLYVEGSDLAR